VLGAIEVVHAGQALALGGSRERAVLARLLLSANQVVAQDTLIDDLWPGDQPEGGRAAAVQTYVSRLRKALRPAGGDEVLITRPPGYVLAVEPDALDAARFEALVRQARRSAADGQHDGAAATFAEALALWRGPAYPGLNDLPFARAEAARLEEARLDALEARIEADLACGQAGALIGELASLTGEHPLRERLWALRRTDGVIVHSASYRAALIGQGLDARRVAQVTAGVDARWFSPGRAPELRARWGIPAGAPLAGIVARMKPERGHDVLLRAFALVQRELPQAWLVLIGRGEAEQRLRGLAGGLGIAHVVFAGYLRGPGLVQAYRALDVAVWLREGNDGACRGVLEAMACAVPVIAGDDGAPPELVAGTGRVVSPADPSAIAAALLELLGDVGRARRLGRAARDRALEFTPRRAADETLSFWRRLRDLPPARP